MSHPAACSPQPLQTEAVIMLESITLIVCRSTTMQVFIEMYIEAFIEAQNLAICQAITVLQRAQCTWQRGLLLNDIACKAGVIALLTPPTLYQRCAIESRRPCCNTCARELCYDCMFSM